MALGGFGMLLFLLCGSILILVPVSVIGTLLYMPNFSSDVDLTYDIKFFLPEGQ